MFVPDRIEGPNGGLTAVDAPGDSAARDLAFLAAWERDSLPRSIDAGTILRIRQMRRAGAAQAKSERP
jgi:hypothetical protein